MNPKSFLRKVPIFSELSDEDLDHLAQSTREFELPAGEVLFTEGSPGRHAYIIQSGQIEILKASGGREIQLAIRQPGEVIGEMALLESCARSATCRAYTSSVLLEIDSEQFDHLFDTSPSAARKILTTITNRLRTTESLLQQSEKLAQLGTLTAGIAHELNNPAAAVKRGAQQLQLTLERFQEATHQLYQAGLSRDQIQKIQQLEREFRSRSEPTRHIDAITRGDLEEELEHWLEAYGFLEAWELASQLADHDLNKDVLAPVISEFPKDHLPAILTWIVASQNIFGLLDEIRQGAGRISEIIKALKAYVYLDEAPNQEIDIHEGLENTLVILRHKMGEGVEIRREYDDEITRIPAYGSELNQVWTNLIDNAIDAIAGKGTITIRTRLHAPWVMVEIEDNGPGIPPDVKARLFSPFFTTKPLGQGTGLGLYISYNIIQKHGGDIKVTSHTGMTRFTVLLPLHSPGTPSDVGGDGNRSGT
jgi:signal transduction histidine kinase